MFSSLALLLLTLAGEEGFTQLLADEKSPAEYGHELTKEEALAGWIALFDGETTFGFRDAKLEVLEARLPGAKFLAGGVTTSPFHHYTLKIDVVRAGKLQAGEKFSVDLPIGLQLIKIAHPPAPLRMADGLAVRRWSLLPGKMEPLLNGKDLAGWRAIPYPNVAAGTKVSWAAKNGFVHAHGGPGALEYQGDAENTESPMFQDFLLQVDVRTAARHTNGGIFLRNQPGTVMMGYEAQLHNRVYDTRKGERGCCTGSVDDRQHARKLACRDGELFRMTTLIAGPHISIWVNGYQTCDWTDTRPADTNPRRGLRLEGGTLQLQAHDPETDLEFHQVLIGRYSLLER